MTIKEILDKFKNAKNDTILARDIQLNVRATFIPEDPLVKYTILEDETGILEAVPATKKIFESLKPHIGKSELLTLKGRLDKTGFGNIAFAIEEIIE
ncbi:MAG: hypothetical protein HYY52_05390 [Candidatus Melainabacteria bacterium]|nr:hypothetical protein [Candidatus Melainabacteria bacterium]